MLQGSPAVKGRMKPYFALPAALARGARRARVCSAGRRMRNTVASALPPWQEAHCRLWTSLRALACRAKMSRPPVVPWRV